MDLKVPSDKVAQELARELLIAISYSVPGTDRNSNHASKNLNGANGAAVANADGAEKFRSELISISYAQSPDAQVPPVVLGNHSSRTNLLAYMVALDPSDGTFSVAEATKLSTNLLAAKQEPMRNLGQIH